MLGVMVVNKILLMVVLLMVGMVVVTSAMLSKLTVR